MTSTSGKKSNRLQEINDLLEQAESRQRAKSKTTTTKSTSEKSETNPKFDNINANTFKKILWREDLSAEEKKNEVAKALSFTSETSKEESKKILAEYELLKEWLQYQRKQMSQRLISLTDTEAFSELKEVYDQINQALLDFDNKMQPLTDIVDAVFDIRMAGGDVIFEIFREIKEEKDRKEALTKEQEAYRQEVLKLEEEARNLQVKKAQLKSDRSFFGLGPIKKEALVELSQIDAVEAVELENKRQSLAEKIAQNETELSKAPETQYQDLVNQKAKLQELLDISSEEHKERQKQLVLAANNFVSTTEERVSEVMSHLEGRNQHIDGVSEMNSSMESIYTVLREAEKASEANNQSLRDNLLSSVLAEESAISKMQKEKQVRAVEEHITSIDTIAVDTGSTLAELSNATFQIKSMKDGNLQQIAKTRAIQSSGIAGVAQRLATTLDALSGAALNEASEMTNISLGLMNDKTNRTIAKDALRKAAGLKDQSDYLSKAIEDLASMGQVIKKASELTRENVSAVKEKIKSLEEVTKDIQADVRDSYSINAEVGKSSGNNEDKKPEEKSDNDIENLKI